MRRKLLFAAFALLIVIAGVGVYLYNSIDSIVKNAIERSGSEITGTKVSVGSVEISLRSGQGTIRNLRVDNPDGFADEKAVEFGELTLEVDIASLNRDPIVINEIRVKSPLINAEVDEKYVTNVGIIRNHVQEYRAAAPEPAAGKQDAGYEKHFVIRSFVIEEGVINGDATRIGRQERELTLPPVKLSNVGGTRGVRADAIGKTVANALFAQIQQTVAEQLKAAAIERVQEKVKEILNR